MADTDLTKTIIPYLDRHLVFPLLAHLLETEIFPVEDVQRAQYELAKSTSMVDYAVHLYGQVYGEDKEVPAEFSTKRDDAVSTNERLQQDAQAVLDVIDNPDVIAALRQDKNQNLAYLKENHNLSLEHFNVLYNYGQFQFACGNYSTAADYLYHFRVLSTDNDLLTSSHWGKLASDILRGEWSIALEELNTLRDAIDSRATPLIAPPTGAGAGAPSATQGPLLQLHSRSWLLHWSLFVYFNHEQGRTLLLETFLAPAYLNTIQTSCPWILRYVATAAILARKAASATGAGGASGKVRHALKEVVKIVQLEGYQYKDPVTEFLRELYVEFDFEAAQRQLALAEEVVANDFFLGEFKDEFLEDARYLVTEAYCRIHQQIDIGALSERLNLSRDEGEKWIVNLIRETRMGADAKIDLAKNVITIARPPQPVYQTVIERTRGLAFRTQAMGVAMERSAQAAAAAAAAPPPAPVEAAPAVAAAA